MARRCTLTEIIFFSEAVGLETLRLWKAWLFTQVCLHIFGCLGEINIDVDLCG